MASNHSKGWTKVGYRKQGGLKIGSRKKNGAAREGGEARKSSTFIVTEFADFLEATNVYYEFKDLGDIDEVYILNKRTR